MTKAPELRVSWQTIEQVAKGDRTTIVTSAAAFDEGPLMLRELGPFGRTLQVEVQAVEVIGDLDMLHVEVC